MTKVIAFEGNTVRISRTFSLTDTLNTTLAAYDLLLTLKDNVSDDSALTTIAGTISGTGVVFDIPYSVNLVKGIYTFEITAETGTKKLTLEQDRMLIKESEVYVS